MLAHQRSQQLCYGTKRGSAKQWIVETWCWKYGVAAQRDCLPENGDSSLRQTNVIYSHLQFPYLHRYINLHLYIKHERRVKTVYEDKELVGMKTESRDMRGIYSTYSMYML